MTNSYVYANLFEVVNYLLYLTIAAYIYCAIFHFFTTFANSTIYITDIIFIWCHSWLFKYV